MNTESSNVPQIVMLPSSTLDKIQETQNMILEKLENIQTKKQDEEYLTAVEFMNRTKMCRASFDEKRANNEFRVIKKGRKIFVKASEVQKYFEGEI